MAEKISIDAAVLRDHIAQDKTSFERHRFGAENESYKSPRRAEFDEMTHRNFVASAPSV